MRITSAIAALACLAACGDMRTAENPGTWFDPGSDYDVTEPIEFTDVNYGFAGPTEIASLTTDPALSPAYGSFETWFAPSDAPPASDCDGWLTSSELPVTVEGIVTILPRYYFKTSGCLPNLDVDSDEKYYGSYFIQDRSGGVFVLGDSKVAHFDMGDRVTLNVRAIKEAWSLKMVSTHDVVEIERGPEPIFYETVTESLGEAHVGKVVRVAGTVITEPTTFGEVYIEADDGTVFKVGIDAELSRRGVGFDVGSRIEVTGPVIFAFDEFPVVIMRVGQVSEIL